MNNNKGFTLIELLIAVLVMVLALGALVYGLTQSQRLAQTVRLQDIAVNAAQGRLEEINENVMTIMSYDQNPFPVPGPEPLAPDLVGNVWVNQIPNTNLFDVTVAVTWQQIDGRLIGRRVDATLLQR